MKKRVIKSRKLHKLIGLILVLPMLGWTFTGLIFFIKPGYQEAYEQLTVKRYPLTQAITFTPKNNWQEVSIVKTVLGNHLLVQANNKSEHLDFTSLLTMPEPTKLEFEALLNDAFASNKARYGEIVSTKGLTAKTSTGVEVKLNWKNLKLSQHGQDTKLINLLYQVHYLQWTPFKELNQALGILGLLLLVSLTALGVRMYLKQRA